MNIIISIKIVFLATSWHLLHADYWSIFYVVPQRGGYHHKSTDNKNQILDLEVSRAKSKDQSLFGRVGRIVYYSESRSRAEYEDTVCPAFSTFHPIPKSNVSELMSQYLLGSPESNRAQDQRKLADGVSRQRTQRQSGWFL